MKKIVYEDRARFYADPRFADVNMERLLSKSYAAERLALLDPLKASRRLPAGNGILEPGDTVYLTVADAKGNVISLIQSNYMGFGSGVVPADSGFTLQDRGGTLQSAGGSSQRDCTGQASLPHDHPGHGYP